MMSDTGLFLNWNPDWPQTEIGRPHHDEKMKKEVLSSWDQEYEDALQNYENYENERYSSMSSFLFDILLSVSKSILTTFLR